MSTDATSALARGSLRWYWNRMRVMNPLELHHRAVSAANGLKDHTLDRLGVLAPAPRKTWVMPEPWLPSAGALPDVQAGPYLREAEELATGRVAGADGGHHDLGVPADWTSVTRTSPVGPVVDDVRFAMELHRHGHLVRLAQAWRLGRDRSHLAALFDHLGAWLTQCPYPRGVAWSSALDAGLRLLNWSIVWQLLQADQDDSVVPEALGRRWVESVYVHARFVRQNRSRYSSANNHLLGELLGLVVAEATWPLWPEVMRWGAAARREFAVEILKQVHEDGTGREQASWYQCFVFELAAVHLRIEAAAGRPVDERILRRLGSMARFIAALRDSAGNLSHHGDADHARALSVDPGPHDPYARLLALAVDLGVAPELRPLCSGPSSVSPWLLGDVVRDASPAPPAQRLAARAALPRSFPQGGYHLLGRRFGEADEVLMTMDAGPLGYLGIAAHGHADALSLRLSVGGRPVLVDRGTYTYNAEPGWRHFFRSTLAHNTVCIDETDQSLYGGPFLWPKHANSQLESFASTDTAGHVMASHDGYGSLRRALVHQRRVEWLGTDNRFVVADTLRTEGPHRVAVAWHFDPACAVEIAGAQALVRTPGASLRLTVSDANRGGHWELHHGSPDSMLGWHSPTFGVRCPAPSLVWRTRIGGTATLSTQIDIENDNESNQGKL